MHIAPKWHRNENKSQVRSHQVLIRKHMMLFFMFLMHIHIYSDYSTVHTKLQITNYLYVLSYSYTRTKGIFELIKGLVD